MLKKNILFSDWQFDLKKAQGSYIWNSKGNRLIDFTSGWNVTNLGWNHPEITKAMVNQLKVNTYAPMWTADPIQNELAKELTSSLPKELVAVGRATGGTEANEEALKTARAYTGRKKILSFKDTYHGQSFATISIGFKEYADVIAPLVGGIIRFEYPNTYRTIKSSKVILEEFEKKIEKILKRENVAAIITEAGIITGWGSTYVAPKGYLKLLRRLTKKYGTLLILDEVGTGFSRCGKLYGMELERIVPDIATFAKGMSNGVAPIGAMVTTKTIADKTCDKTTLISTFGWNPPSCAAALKTLQIHQREKIWEKSKKDGMYFINLLKKELDDDSRVGDIRGIGMEVGVDFVKSKSSKEPNEAFAQKVITKAYKNGLHLVLGSGGNIQLMPPLTIEKSVLDKGIEIFVNSVKELK